MNEDLFNDSLNIGIRTSRLIDYLASNRTFNDNDYIYENYLLGQQRRFRYQLNKGLSNNLIEKNAFDLALRINEKNLDIKINDCSAASSALGSKNVINFSINKPENLNDDINHNFTNLSINEFFKFRKDHSDYKTLAEQLDFNLFEKPQNDQPIEPPRNDFPCKPVVFEKPTIENIPSQSNYFAEQSNTPSQTPSSKFSFAKPGLSQANPSSTNTLSNNNNSNYGTGFGNNSSNSIPKMQSTIKYEPRISRCYKRRNEDDINPAEENNDMDSNPFKSAKEQLQINSSKQQQQQQGYQPQASIQNQSAASSNYSLAKRPTIYPTNSTAPKRGVHSKFSLPIRSNEEDNSSNQNNNSNYQNKINPNNNNNESNNIDMANMKNIDQKLIDIIMSEVMDRTPPITWDDIAGLEFVKKTIKEIVIWPMLRPDIFNGLRGPPKGLLLFGPPGTGKTLIAKCIANESKSTFFNISSSTLTSKWQGESEKLVKVLFEIARAYQPAVIFIDEIDSLLAQRSDDDRESSRRLKTEFFVQMDGARTTGEERILLIGATNRPQELDDAARRRFVKKLYIPLPEATGRKQIIQNLMKKQSCSLTDFEIEKIAEITAGYSGADMTNLCREAALGPIRSIELCSIATISVDQVRAINYNDFIDAMSQMRATVSDSDLESYVKWNNSFGSVAILNK